MKDQAAKELAELKLKNRIKVNRYLNTVLWFFGIAAPAIALGIWKGIFHDISYGTCIGIFAVVMHRGNIKRLLKGEEKKIHAKK